MHLWNHLHSKPVTYKIRPNKKQKKIVRKGLSPIRFFFRLLGFFFLCFFRLNWIKKQFFLQKKKFFFLNKKTFFFQFGLKKHKKKKPNRRKKNLIGVSPLLPYITQLYPTPAPYPHTIGAVAPQNFARIHTAPGCGYGTVPHLRGMVVAKNE